MRLEILVQELVLIRVQESAATARVHVLIQALVHATKIKRK
jgi:hypothetical protein